MVKELEEVAKEKKEDWNHYLSDLKKAYFEDTDKLKKAISDVNVKDMNYATMGVLCVFGLLYSFFPGDYIYDMGKKVRSLFNDAYKTAVERGPPGDEYCYKSNIESRIEQLESLLRDYPERQKKLRESLGRLDPRNLQLADNFAST